MKVLKSSSNIVGFERNGQTKDKLIVNKALSSRYNQLNERVWQMDTDVLNLNGQRLTFFQDFLFKSPKRRARSLTSKIFCYDKFFVVQRKITQNDSRIYAYTAYSYTGEVLKESRRCWNGNQQDIDALNQKASSKEEAATL